MEKKTTERLGAAVAELVRAAALESEAENLAATRDIADGVKQLVDGVKAIAEIANAVESGLSKLSKESQDNTTSLKNSIAAVASRIDSMASLLPSDKTRRIEFALANLSTAPEILFKYVSNSKSGRSSDPGFTMRTTLFRFREGGGAFLSDDIAVVEESSMYLPLQEAAKEKGRADFRTFIYDSLEQMLGVKPRTGKHDGRHCIWYE